MTLDPTKVYVQSVTFKRTSSISNQHWHDGCSNDPLRSPPFHLAIWKRLLDVLFFPSEICALILLKNRII